MATAEQPPAPPEKCAWLAAEGLRLEAKAAELDREGKGAEAAFRHRRAAEKLAEAAALCPIDHPDGPALSDLATQVSLRAIYLESLGGGAAELPLEDHVGDAPALVMDISSAAQPEEEAVSALLARGGASGESAPLNEEGFQLVAALKNEEETKVYIRRVLDAGGRRVRRDAEAELGAFARDRCGGGAPGGLAGLREALQTVAWTELNIDPSKDKMEVAVQLEQEAKALETRGMEEQAAEMCDRALAVFRYVHKYDPRMKNAKVKDMVGKRIDELVERANNLKARLQPTQVETAAPAAGAGPRPDDVEERLRILRGSS